MSDKDQGKKFGEMLMGMEGFTPARAEKYRVEMEGLLAHRLKSHERWWMGAEGLVVGTALIVGGVAMATAREHPEVAQMDDARWTVAATCVLSGILLGAWLLRVAFKGQYGRRSGDLMGLVIVLVFAGGWGAGLLDLALGTVDGVLRTKLFLVGGILLIIPSACLLLAILQWMHRQTQERLLRIEYRLAELMEHREQ
jgi:hypothetical protein